MVTETEPSQDKRLPLPWVWTVLAICTMPVLLNLAGVDLQSRLSQINLQEVCELPAAAQDDAIHRSLAGSFTHTIMQWTAFCTAFFTAVLAFVHYVIKKDATTPIIGMALLCAACMDAFHTLAADRLIDAVADNRVLIPFTWTLAQIFNGLILIVGVGCLLLRRRRTDQAAGVPLVVGMSLFFGVTAFAVIDYCANSSWLPQMQFPGSWVSRPYDMIPLVLFMFAFVFVYRPFHRWEQTLFSHSLVVSVIPQIVAQLHLAFGSQVLFDNHFNAAHALKVVAYGVPFVGLVLDYIYTYQRQHRQSEDLAAYAVQQVAAKHELMFQAEQLKAQSQELRRFTSQLETSNRELEEFARVASHDLQEPLRKVQTFGNRLQSKFAEHLPEQAQEYVQRMQNATGRMQQLINDLLTFSRVTTRAKPFVPVDLSEVARMVLADLEVRVEETGGQVHMDDLPTIDAEPTQMRQLLQNLISNALKYHAPGRPPIVRVQSELIDNASRCQISVSDNGIGFDMKYADRIFAVFQRLHGRDQYEGTGVGLAVCRKIADRHHGSITVQSQPNQGTTFTVTLPVRQDQSESDPVEPETSPEQPSEPAERLEKRAIECAT